MKAVEILRQYWEHIEQLLIHARFCAGHDIQTAECRDFWLGTVYVAIGLGLLIAFIIAKKTLGEQLEFYRNKKKLEARKSADAKEERVWAVPNVEAVVDSELSQAELAAKIGQALKARAQESPVIAPQERTDGKSEASPQQELAAIILTDMVGFSGSMQHDEQRTYAKLLEHNKIVRAEIAKYRGREIKTIGDAFLVIYRSALDAVKCAIAIQRALAEYNLAKDDADKILIRIGVHLGEVMITANDVFGDGVNIAARIEPLAEPGGICITGEVFALVRKKIKLKFERLDGVQLKNIAIAPDIYRINMRRSEPRSSVSDFDI
jgi:class 3 adenylate cyclase